jgi:hypothetical protein
MNVTERNKIIAFLLGVAGVLVIVTGLWVTPVFCRGHVCASAIALFVPLVGGISLVGLAVYYFNRWKVRDSQVV